MYRKFKQEHGGFSPYTLLPPIVTPTNRMGCCPSNSLDISGGSGIGENDRSKYIIKDTNSNKEPSQDDDVMELQSQFEKMLHKTASPPITPPHKNDNSQQEILKKRISNVMKREKTGIKTDFKKMVKKASDLFNSNLDNYTEEILRGKITVDCPPTAKIVRIFTSSTFTDTRHERNYLMEKTYPRLKEFCQDLGYEFQVVDMRWGVRDEATDDHMTTELCLKEVELCNKLSTGPSFVTFLSHKYGYRDLQREIEAGEFEKLFNAVQTEEVKNLLSRWFTRDDNSVPPTYLLQPISSRIPQFISEVEDEKSLAKKLWSSEREAMRQGLVEAAKQILDPESSHIYLRSVTETEIDRGLVYGGERAYWFQRHIKDIETAKPIDILKRYRECIGREEDIKESHQLLNKLSEEKLRSKLPVDHILTYPIHWTNKGIDPVSDKAHKLYIEKLGHDFEKTIKKSVLEAIVKKEVDLINTPLYQEVFQHIIFCQEKCKAFHGREETFHIIQEYMNDPKSDEPLIVHGTSGSGKTSIMAMAVKNAWSSEIHQSTIIRFLGTTPDSSNIGSLLLSIINQIRTVYNQDLVKSGLTLKELTVEFENTLELAMKDRPLLVVLDSLDQLDITGGARQLFWLPSQLPKHVKMIVSTLPEPEYECFPRLQAMFTNPKRFLPVCTLSNHDVEGILNKWLENNHRKLLDQQLQAVIDAFHKCPIPLFLKLAFDEACRWKSFTPADQSVLNTTVRTVINDLFNRIEKLHGELLVSRALGYLTLSSGGLTEAELEDILSCDDDVLNDVYMYWTPPVRRLPPLLLVRIKAELGQYFVDRGSDGVRVFYWYHRQFIEAAYDKYCSDEKTRKKMNGVLADYFSGVWANGNKKPYTSKSGESSSADRFVAAQPIKFSNKSNQSETLNLRKLNNLPHHRLQADQKELLKSECLCNFDFVLHKLKGSGLRPLLDDFSEAKQKYEDDTDICSICDALQLSQHSLQYNPQELSSQLLGRLKTTKGLEKLLQECKNTPFYYLLPSKSMLVQPGGSLLFCLAHHTNDIYGLDLNKTGELAATCAYDNTIKVISVKSGKLINSFDIEGKDPENVRFCNNDETLIVTCDDFVLAVRCQTGLKQYTLKWKDKGTVGICGENKETIGVFGGTMVVLYDAATGKMLRAVECEFFKEKKLSFGSYAPCVGSKRYMATVDDDNYKVLVFDAETNQFLHMTNIFEPYKDSDGDDTQDTVDAMVISPDCKHIIVSTIMKNDLLIYDITNMKLVREIPGESKDSCEKYQLTPDGKTLYFPFRNEVIAFDMETGERFVAIHHPTNVENVSTLDRNIFVTTGDDRIVRIWDRSRTDGDSHTSTSGKSLIKKWDMLMDNPRYAIIRRKENKADKDYFLEMVDLSNDEVLKRDKFIGNISYMHNLEGTRFLITNNESAIVYNAKTGEIEKSFKGVIPRKAVRDIKVFPSKKEFCVLSRGRKNLKIIDIETGKVEIIKGCGERMEDIMMNETGTTIVCSIRDSEEALLFDIEKKQVLYELKANMIPGCKKDDTLYIVGSILSDDGKYFILSTDLTPDCIKHNESASSVSIPVVWHIESKKVHQILCDEKYVKMYANPDDDIDVTYDISEMKMLDKTTLLSSHDDFIVRVFNIETGVLLKRLFGHTSNVELSVQINSPLFLTFATWSEENAIRVWDRETYECLASYCMDSGLDSVQFSPDGCRIIALPKNEYPLYFEVNGGTGDQYKPNKPLDQYEQLFDPTDLINEIKVPSGDADAPNDNDDDPPEPNSDSDDTDDDDKDLKEDDLDDLNFDTKDDFGLDDLDLDDDFNLDDLDLNGDP